MLMFSDFGLTKAQVLCALYNKAGCFNMGLLAYSAGDLSLAEAEEQLKISSYFDYLKGRVMKVDLSKDYLDERLYDRDNGYGAAEYALLDYATDPTRRS